MSEKTGWTSLDYITEINRLEKELKKYEWISVKDRLPTSGDPVMVTTGNWGDTPDVCTAQLWTNKDGSNPEWRDYYGDDVERLMGASVTHWMPLPEPPKETDVE